MRGGGGGGGHRRGGGGGGVVGEKNPQFQLLPERLLWGLVCVLRLELSPNSEESV